MADAPVLDVTPTDGRLEYAEGLDDRAPRVPGERARSRRTGSAHGLGYTTWDVRVARRPGRGDGRRLRRSPSASATPASAPGKQVVQVYASRPGSAVARPAALARGLRRRHRGSRRGRRRPGRRRTRRPCGTGTPTPGLGGRARRPRPVRRPRAPATSDARPPSRSGTRHDLRALRAAGRAPGRAARHPDDRAAAVLAAARRRPRAARLPDHGRQRLGQRLGGQRPEPAGALRGPAAGVLAAGRVAGRRSRPTWARARSRRPAWFETGLLWTEDWQASWVEPGQMPDGAPGERPAALLRFEFDVDRPVVSRPPARHRAGHLRGVPQRCAGRRRRADPRLHPVRRSACRCRPTTSPRPSARGATRSASSSPTAGSAGRPASPRSADQWGEPAGAARPAAPDARRRLGHRRRHRARLAQLVGHVVAADLIAGERWDLARLPARLGRARLRRRRLGRRHRRRARLRRPGRLAGAAGAPGGGDRPGLGHPARRRPAGRRPRARTSTAGSG